MARVEEHNKSIEREDVLKSALCQRQASLGHGIIQKPLIHCIKVLDSDPRNLYRKVKEVIYIKLFYLRRQVRLNCMDSYDLPDLYLPLLQDRRKLGSLQYK